MGPNEMKVAIVSEGAYGWSLIAHVRSAKASVRSFGDPTEFWTRHMLPGMRLRSESFASDLYDFAQEYTSCRYRGERLLCDAVIGLPVAVEAFAAYGMEMHCRYVSGLKRTRVERISRNKKGFELHLLGRERLLARKVVVVTGVANFSDRPLVPPSLRSSHECRRPNGLGRLSGRTLN